ncbi:CapA family protein [Staphylococcus equorum]|uniref:CapA family protein n=1 Tax=Staphylococcus equorum TaxID=246432 RepID=A0A9X4LBN5_9STAP|nr:CapA family protein [Staphylococcus equorum]MDG0843843.1 CapA family protein [Staphylococcus equorum]MDG0860134.1 CapA family protein [Staphylococcus equorum]
MWKYKIMMTLLFTVFIFFSGLCLHDQNQLEDKVSFYAVGDNLIHPVVYQDALQDDGSFDFKPMYDDLEKDIKSADISYINQESPIGGDEKGFSGYKQFNTPRDMADDIAEMGFDIVNGSNNHALDQGTDGLLNEIDLWGQFDDILYTGTFNSQKMRDNIPVFERNGIKVALLSYTYGTNDISPKKPYHINYFNEAQIKKDVAKAKAQSDAVIVSAHWGSEGEHEPNRKQEKYAEVFANAGVDVVIGTHPHVIQPIEWVKGKRNHKTLVAYSLGNFLNGQTTGNESNVLGGNIRFNIEKLPKGVTIKNVEWQSLVTHYEIANPLDDNTRHRFKMYPLKKYNDNLAKRHALSYDDENDVTKQRLETITKDVIDKRYLTPDSY